MSWPVPSRLTLPCSTYRARLSGVARSGRKLGRPAGNDDDFLELGNLTDDLIGQAPGNNCRVGCRGQVLERQDEESRARSATPPSPPLCRSRRPSVQVRGSTHPVPGLSSGGHGCRTSLPRRGLAPVTSAHRTVRPVGAVGCSSATMGLDGPRATVASRESRHIAALWDGNHDRIVRAAVR